MEQQTHLEKIILTIWHTNIWGIEVGQIVIAAAILIVAFLLRGLFSRAITAILRLGIRRLSTSLDERALTTLTPPLRFIPVVIGLFFALHSLDPTGGLQTFADQVVHSLSALTVFWLLYCGIDFFAPAFKQLQKLISAELVTWLIKVLRLLVAFVGVSAVLEIWGIQVGPILAGFGLIGVAVALGAQDMFKNLISGLLIIIEKRFKLGDWVQVEGIVEGIVEHIGFRSTLVRRFDKAPVYVPNAKFSDNAMVNFSETTYRRISWVIGVEYSTTVAQLRQIRDEIAAYLDSNPAFAKPPAVPTFVHIDKFANSSIDIMLYCFTKTTVWGEWLAAKEQLAYEIKEIVERAGTGFAFPSQSLYVESLPETLKPEPFEPPTKSRRKAPAQP